MLNHHHGTAIVNQGLEYPQKRPDVQGVQADGGLVKDKHRVRLLTAHLAGKLQALGFPAGKAGRLLPQRQIAEPQTLEDAKPLADGF